MTPKAAVSAGPRAHLSVPLGLAGFGFLRGGEMGGDVPKLGERQMVKGGREAGQLGGT